MKEVKKMVQQLITDLFEGKGIVPVLFIIGFILVASGIATVLGMIALGSSIILGIILGALGIIGIIVGILKKVGIL